MESDLDRLRAPLEAMMRWFGAAGVRAAVIGGVAASLLGKPRLTKDMDIENIIQATPGLDVERIRGWVREFSAVLEMPEIYEELEKLLRRRQR